MQSSDVLKGSTDLKRNSKSLAVAQHNLKLNQAAEKLTGLVPRSPFFFYYKLSGSCCHEGCQKEGSKLKNLDLHLSQNSWVVMSSSSQSKKVKKLNPLNLFFQLFVKSRHTVLQQGMLNISVYLDLWLTVLTEIQGIKLVLRIFL